MRVFSTLIAIAALAASPSDVEAARADYAQQQAAGIEARYLDFGAVPDELRGDLLRATQFWLPHLSASTVLDRQRPAAVAGAESLARIDLGGLGWTTAAWCKAFGSQYAGTANPLIVRADFLLALTADAGESTAYYDLLYSQRGKPPATEAEFFAFWKLDVARAAGRDHALILDEGRSGVAYGSRLLIWAQSPAAYAWRTRDSIHTVAGSDPLENLGGKLKFDAGELIVGIPKIDTASGLRGQAQVYLLTDGNGNRLEEANPRIVRDHTDRIPVIRTPSSCVRCHVVGINEPGSNHLRDVLAAGVEVYQYTQAEQEEIERFYLTSLGVEVARNQEDFATFCRLAAGATPAECVESYTKVLAWYAQPVTLEQAARELGTTSEELTLAIAAYSTRFTSQAFPGRLAGLAHGLPVGRETWRRETYGQAALAIKLWRE